MLNDDCYTLYIHTAPNGKKYVGITSKKPEERWRKGLGYRRSYFERAIKKYGWENIEHEVVVDGISKEDAILLEQSFIDYLETLNRDKGYNISSGGEVPANGVDSFEYKLKQSLKTHKRWELKQQTISSRKPPIQKENKYKKRVYQYDADGNLLKVHESIRDAANNLGVCVMSVSEACNKEGRKCKGFTLRFEKDEYKSDGRKGGWQSRPVIQFGIDGTEIQRFKCATDAAKKFGRTNPGTILDACNGRGITAYGFMWRFEESC